MPCSRSRMRTCRCSPSGRSPRCSRFSRLSCAWLDEFDVVRPSRSSGGQRRYSRTEVTVVRYVAQLADEGMTLAAIRRVLELEQQVMALQAERDALLAALAQRDELLAALARRRRQAPPVRSPGTG